MGVGWNALNAAKASIEHPKTLPDRKVENFSVQLLVTAVGKMKISDVAKMLQIG
jgi:hypothetical protein